MPIFQRYLLKELLINSVITFGVITMIFIVGGALTILHKMSVITLGTFATGVYFFVGTNLDKMLPMTVLVATVITFGRWAADNEITSLRACGISMYTLLAPGALFGLLGVAIVLHVNDRVAASMEFHTKDLLEQSLPNLIAAAKERTSGELPFGKDKVLLYEGVDQATGDLKNVRYKQYESSEDDKSVSLKNEVRAKRAQISFDERKGEIYLDCRDVESVTGGSAGVNFGALQLKVPLRDETIEKKVRHCSLAELIAAEDRDYEGSPKNRTIQTEFHQRIAGAFACFLFIFLGMPLALIFRHGNRMVAFLIAFLIAIVVYYPTFILGESLAKDTDLNPLLAIWSGSAMLALLGTALTIVVLRR